MPCGSHCSRSWSSSQKTFRRSMQGYPARDHHREKDKIECLHTTELDCGDCSNTNGHGSDDRADAMIIQVCPHPCNVPDVVPDVIGDNRRISRVIFGMPASTFPTRSAPTSAALVKMPPPTRAKRQWSCTHEKPRRNIHTLARVKRLECEATKRREIPRGQS